MKDEVIRIPIISWNIFWCDLEDLLLEMDKKLVGREREWREGNPIVDTNKTEVVDLEKRIEK